MTRYRYVYQSAVIALFLSPMAAGQPQDDRPRTCRDITNWRSEDRYRAESEEVRTLDSASVSKLELRPARNSGVTVIGQDRRDFEIRLCRSAIADTQAEADSIVAQISVNIVAGRVEVRGPETLRRWSAHLIVHAPRNAAIDAQASNGPIGLRDLSGCIEARTANGPISLRQVTGEVIAEAVNGPISVTDSGGNHKLTASNGPISVRLAGQRWEGAGLQAETRNGPLSLRVPDAFESGILIEKSRMAPLRCRIAQCPSSTAGRTERVELGRSPAIVRLTTVNGPVSIASR